MAHDFKKFPELSSGQMGIYYWDSPHKQITENFHATVIRVKDGDTIQVTTDFRDFDFPIRFAKIAAPEKHEEGGQRAKSWLTEVLLGEEVEVEIDADNRTGKFGRILGEIIHNGININYQLVDLGYSEAWDKRQPALLPEFGSQIAEGRWF